MHSHGNGSNSIHLALDPRSDRVGLFGELATQHFVVLLFAQFGLQGAISLGNQLAHFGPLGRDILRNGMRQTQRKNSIDIDILQTTKNNNFKKLIKIPWERKYTEK